MSETKRYQVVGTDLCHNGEVIREGQTVDLTDKDAADLQLFLVEVSVPIESVVTQPTDNAEAGNKTDKVPETQPTTKKGSAK